MKRHEAITEIARVIYEQHDDATDLIGYITGSTEPLTTWSNDELAEQLEYINGDKQIEIVDERAAQFADLDRHEIARVELATYIATFIAEECGRGNTTPDAAMIFAALEAFAGGAR